MSTVNITCYNKCDDTLIILIILIIVVSRIL